MCFVYCFPISMSFTLGATHQTLNFDLNLTSLDNYFYLNLIIIQRLLALMDHHFVFAISSKLFPSLPSPDQCRCQEIHLLFSSCFVGLAVPSFKSVLVLTGACRGVSQGVRTGPRALGHHYLPQLAD